MKAGILFIFMLLIIMNTLSFGGVINYDNDPNLAKALEYCLEANPGNYEKGNRELAEKYFLAYLEVAEDSFQKARIYDYLGAMYAVAINPKLNEKPDYEKATYYYRKVLELEPVRIAKPTIRARTMLASMKGLPVKTVIESRLNNYEWVNGIDSETIEDNWLPERPDELKPSKNQMIKTTGLCDDIKSDIETNVMSSIHALFMHSDPAAEEFLLEITHRFEGTRLCELAIEKMKEKGIVIPVKDQPKQKEASLTKEESIETDIKIEEDDSADIPDQSRKGSTLIWILTFLLVFAALVVAVYFRLCKGKDAGKEVD